MNRIPKIGHKDIELIFGLPARWRFVASIRKSLRIYRRRTDETLFTTKSSVYDCVFIHSNVRHQLATWAVIDLASSSYMPKMYMHCCTNDWEYKPLSIGICFGRLCLFSISWPCMPYRVETYLKYCVRLQGRPTQQRASNESIPNRTLLPTATAGWVKVQIVFIRCMKSFIFGATTFNSRLVRDSWRGLPKYLWRCR